MNFFKSMIIVSGLLLGIAGAVQAKDHAGVVVPKTAGATPATVASAPASTALMDINTATVKELATLPKIGDARAAAIVKGRPYKGKDALVQKKILSEDVYAAIKDLIIAKQEPKTKADIKK